MDSACITRTTFHDRSPFLQLSLDYQKLADHATDLDTYIFVDPHPQHGYCIEYNSVIADKYKRINWPRNSGIYSWYDSVKYIFDNTDYEYVITIEDDVIISRDYLRLCIEIINNGILIEDNNILYFHIGAWEQPKGNKNLIVRSSASLRSSLISRQKFFQYVVPFYAQDDVQISGLDLDIQTILKLNKMSAIAPQMNRHAHIGVYGWSSTGQHASNLGKNHLLGRYKKHHDLYNYLSQVCFSRDKLLELNRYGNPNYFWDFSPNIDFQKLVFDI